MVASKVSSLSPPPQRRRLRRALGFALVAILTCGALGCGYLRENRRDRKPSKPTRELPPPMLGERSPTGGYRADDTKLANNGRKPTWGDLSAPNSKAGADAKLEKPSTEPEVRSTALPASPILPISAANSMDDQTKVSGSPTPPLNPPGDEARPSPGKIAADASKNATIDSLLASARETLNGVKTYQVRLRRQERVGGNLQPVEEVVLSIRREPRAVRFEWPSGPHKGREVLYEPGEHHGLILVHTPEALIPRVSLSPDSPLVTRTSRHPIGEAGFETILDQIESRLKSARAHEPSAGKYRIEGPDRPEPGGPHCLKIVRETPDRQIEEAFFDPKTHLPALLRITAANGDLLESYRFLNPRLDLPELSLANAFDPDARWGVANVAGGLLQRLSGTKPKAEATR